MKPIGRPKVRNITADDLSALKGLSRAEAAQQLNIDLSALRRAEKAHSVSNLFRRVKKPDLTREILLKNDGLNARQYAEKINYNVNTVYAAIRRFDLSEHYGLGKYHHSLDL